MAEASEAAAPAADPPPFTIAPFVFPGKPNITSIQPKGSFDFGPHLPAGPRHSQDKARRRS